MKDRAQDRSQRRACTGRFCTIFYCDKVQASRCCADCVSPQCSCAQIVVTRFSMNPNRIKVVLVGENLGL